MLLDRGRSGDAAGTDGGGGFDARVEYVEFLGSFARVQLDGAGERLLMDLPIAQVQRFDVAAGNTVRAAVPPDAVRIFAEAPPDG